MPEYCLVPNSKKSPRHPFYACTTIILHRGWTHALGSLDAKNIQNGSADAMVWENVQAVKHIDPYLGTTGIWLNVYSPISTDSTGQDITLKTVAKILDHHAALHTFTILAGDWSASKVPKEGAACTRNTDSRFQQWCQQYHMEDISNKDPTYVSVADRNYLATIDYIFLSTKIPGVTTVSHNEDSCNPFHDHRSLHCVIQGIPCSTLPSLGAMTRPQRIRKDQWVQKKEK